jgi:hypothetical protein
LLAGGIAQGQVGCRRCLDKLRRHSAVAALIDVGDGTA